MASTDSSNWTLISNPPLQKPKSLLLKDYLLDDFSSCSSNGFRSFPRRQCCSTTVRFLLEIDLKVKDSSFTKKFLPRTSSRKIALSTISTLQRASDAVLRAFKQFPLPSSRKSFFPRSISRKLISKAFRKKSDIVDPNNRRWKSFKEFLDEKEPPSSSSFEQNHSDSAVCTAIAVAGRNSISSCSNSISWTESEFTSEIIPSSCSGNSESCSENGAVKDDKDSPVNLIGKRDGVTFGKDSMEETGTPSAVAAAAGEYREDTVKKWQNNEEEKEQFSPVSVLDFPFEDEDQDISSSLNCNIHLMEGKKQKQRDQKTKRLEKGTELEPVDLKKRFTNISVIADHQDHFTLITKLKEHQMEEKALEFLKLLKSTTKSTENLLLDFFHQKLDEHEATSTNSDFDQPQLLEFAQDWVDGNAGELTVMGRWELPEERNFYIKDMEVAEKWRSFGGDKEELVAEFEAEVWISLLDDLLIDLSL
ncbi:hypothetical protein IC582_022320 [Cucumis melo]|uniref:Uncharacterized protein LOC103482706 n=1 Tax=Cucumis melo TaxID=3656 RepID=A0A1S3ATL0_CUCME|nr:uncharacterized protein LOC103482706 [Cucumis melo]